MAEEEEEEVSAFLNKLKTLDFAIYNFQKDVVLNSLVVRNGMVDRSEALGWYETRFRNYNGRAPFQGMNVGNAKNLSHDDLDKISNNFSDCIWKDKDAIFYHGVMDDGQEVTVKTWDFKFPPTISCVDYPRNFHDEIVLLERSELKSCPFLVKLNGFCFEKKLALVYDLKFKRTWKELCRRAEFGWKERMKVANDYALLLKTLTVEKLDLFWTSDDIAIDEEYNIKVMNFRIGCRTSGTSSVAGVAVISDDADITEEIAKAYVLEFGVLLVELIIKRVRDWNNMSKLCLDILQRKGGSAVHESLEVAALQVLESKVTLTESLSVFKAYDLSENAQGSFRALCSICFISQVYPLVQTHSVPNITTVHFILMHFYRSKQWTKIWRLKCWKTT